MTSTRKDPECLSTLGSAELMTFLVTVGAVLAQVPCQRVVRKREQQGCATHGASAKDTVTHRERRYAVTPS
jgi:hypothetical protein